MSKNFKCLNDIYYSKEYGELYLSSGAELVRFDYKENDLFFTNVLLKKPINRIGDKVINENWFDAETPYGYGGYCTNISDPKILNSVLIEYREFCEKQGIINEFVRFNPFLENIDIFENYLDFKSSGGNVVYIDTTMNEEERWKSYHTGTRNILRKCALNLKIVENENLDAFQKLYESTMDKNKASEFYYFDRNYFEKLLNTEGVRLFEVSYEDNIISMGFFMFSENFAHYHLSANDYAFAKYNGNYLMLEHIAKIAHERGIQKFLLGGGRTADAGDGLLRFKKKFSKKELPFYIGGKIYNKEVHDLCRNIWQEQNLENQVNYFQKYRI